MAYATEVLGVTWWWRQEEIARAVVEKRRVLVKASHGIGKTFLAAGIVNWHFDCFNPSITQTTAPTAPQVRDVLWKEIRVQRQRAHGLPTYLLPKEPRMEEAENHYAVGLTAETGTAFQGRHEEHIGIVMDECVGVDRTFWESAEGMMTSEGAWWLAICNPTDVSSEAYARELKGDFHVIRVSVFEHPNIIAELEGEEPPFPAAVRLSWLQRAIKNETTEISAAEATPNDVEFPPGSGRWYRPGAWFESRVLGRWPTVASDSVWSEGIFEHCLRPSPPPEGPLVIGCDVARFGDDYTSIVARRGNVVVWHETHNGWSTTQTAIRLKQLATELTEAGEDPRKVHIYIDDDGVGGGVVDQAEDFTFIGMSGSLRSWEPDNYPNMRSQLWFAVADRAAKGELYLSRLSPDTQLLLRRQALSPRWKLDMRGRRVVEPKSETKRRLGRSPDDMDALNLAFCEGGRQRIEWLGGNERGDAPFWTQPEGPERGWLCPVCSGMASVELLNHYGPAEPPEGRRLMCDVCARVTYELMGYGMWRKAKEV